MRKFAAVLGAAALSAGLMLVAGGAALADDDHSTRDDHSTKQCSREHTINVATCIADVVNLSGGVHIL
jgi:hypothetical protein